MSTEGKVKGVIQLRRYPQFRDCGTVCIMNKRAGEGKVSGKSSDGKSGAFQDFPVKDRLSIRGDQSLHGKTNAKDLFIFKIQGIFERNDKIADLLEVAVFILIEKWKNSSLKFPAIEVNGNDLNLVA